MKAIVIHQYGGPEVLKVEDYRDPVAQSGEVLVKVAAASTAQRLLGKVKQGGVFASVTGAPDNVKEFPSVRVVPFVSKQDAGVLLHMAQAVSSGRLVIPIDRRLPLKDAAQGHAAVEKGANGKVLLLP